MHRIGVGLLDVFSRPSYSFLTVFFSFSFMLLQCFVARCGTTFIATGLDRQSFSLFLRTAFLEKLFPVDSFWYCRSRVFSA